MKRLHTSFLVSAGTAVNKETCLSPVAHLAICHHAMTVADNLRRLRGKRNLSQVELADLAGVSQQLVSQIERGKNVSTKYLPQIAGALGCQPGDIDPSYRVDTALLDDPITLELARAARQLGETERRLLLGAAQGLLDKAREEG
jgi:transcriptional regulator with XRE-family HTH domain